MKLKIHKYKNQIELFILSKIKKKLNIPLTFGVMKQYNYSIINYNLIIILQKYGITASKKLKKKCLTNLFKI